MEGMGQHDFLHTLSLSLSDRSFVAFVALLLKSEKKQRQFVEIELEQA